MGARQFTKLVPTPKVEKKPWGERKGTGSHVCMICGEKIMEKNGERRIRHEKATWNLGRGRTTTFWTYAHAKCKPKHKEPEEGTVGIKEAEK